MVPLRVAILSPTAPPAVTGNAITVERIRRGLVGRAVETRVWDLSAVAADEIERGVVAFAPALVHAFHAFRAGPLGARVARRLGRPLVVTITGTDANRDLDDPERAGRVRRALDAAAAVTVFHEVMTARVAPALGDGPARVQVVPQSVVFEPGPPPGERAADADGPLVLFPAGIRAIKQPRFPLVPLERLRARFPGLALRYAGPILEADEGEGLLAALTARPWARYLGAVPHHAMPALLAGADLVLNCSIAEGGMANAVLEALALGRAVLASADANRSLVRDGVTGALYASEAEFAERAERLLADPALRRRLGEAGRRHIEAEFGPEREMDGYLGVYRHVAAAAGRP